MAARPQVSTAGRQGAGSQRSYRGDRRAIYVDNAGALCLQTQALAGRMFAEAGVHVVGHLRAEAERGGRLGRRPITHVLERTDRRSDTGVTKAHWTLTDYQAMAHKPLPFVGEDIAWIHRTLEDLRGPPPERRERVTAPPVLVCGEIPNAARYNCVRGTPCARIGGGRSSCSTTPLSSARSRRGMRSCERPAGKTRNCVARSGRSSIRPKAACSITLCRSARIRSWASSARAGWAPSTRPGTRASTAWSPSKSRRRGSTPASSVKPMP
ncbi:hypothetical protein SBA6_850013 [Candidatus Sulfopaludibacter sp. SbA6]|nr:hypothetical protein SBA6_850013 [Candidatus Sulfopaludibacter sp. SbA6]